MDEQITPQTSDASEPPAAVARESREYCFVIMSYKPVLKLSANFFCIGSPKVNPATDHFLPLLQERRAPHWQMRQLDEDDENDKRVVIQDLRNTCQPFWAIVRGTLRGSGKITDDDVQVVKAGGYTPP